jgi:hypothetical protein
VSRIEGPTIQACAATHFAMLFLLLRDVVVVWAKGLPVGAIPEQFLIAFVRHYVVNDQVHPPRVRLQRPIRSEAAGIQNSMSLTATAKLVAGLREEDGAGPLPLRRISTVPRGKPVCRHSVGSGSYGRAQTEAREREARPEGVGLKSDETS